MPGSSTIDNPATYSGTVPTTAVIQRLEDDAIVERLIAVRGVGRWTVEMLLIFRLGRADVWPVLERIDGVCREQIRHGPRLRSALAIFLAVAWLLGFGVTFPVFGTVRQLLEHDHEAGLAARLVHEVGHAVVERIQVLAEVNREGEGRGDGVGPAEGGVAAELAEARRKKQVEIDTLVDDFTFNLDSNEFVRITGYLVRKSDLAAIAEGGACPETSVVVGSTRHAGVRVSS